MPNSNQRRAEILGMPFGTACNKLRRMVMFDLLRRHEENVCFKCGKLILKAEDLTLEHKETWQDGGSALFWDLNNIVFLTGNATCRKELSAERSWTGHFGAQTANNISPFHAFIRRESREQDTHSFVEAAPTPKEKRSGPQVIAETVAPCEVRALCVEATIFV
jgi:hypothetical protein